MTASLRRIFAVASREFFASLASPAAWVFLVIFLVMANVCTFVFSDILALGQAELSPFFNWMPWLFMFLMPALGMPLWAEERRVGTFELTRCRKRLDTHTKHRLWRPGQAPRGRPRWYG